MKKLLVSSTFLIASSYCCAAELSPTHPIIGSWRVEVPGTSCSETYTFKSNGTTFVRSASEITETKFVISSRPRASGYYKLKDTIVKTNGKPDCTGSSSPAGDVVRLFLRFDNSGSSFSFCKTEEQSGCVGPFTRIIGNEP
jgi:hypothetical protein